MACRLNNFESLLVAFAFYISYFVMAIPSAKILKYTGFKKGMALGLLIIAVATIFTHGFVSVLFIALMGLANSLMWPELWPLALAGLGRFTKIGSSLLLLIMSIAGGAILPLIYGALADAIHNTQQAYWIKWCRPTCSFGFMRLKGTS